LCALPITGAPFGIATQPSAPLHPTARLRWLA
jgi:hypothetical protein